MKLIGNIVWFVCSGFWAWFAWSFVGLAFSLTIVGIPIGLQCFKIANFGLFPFGKEIEIGQSGTSIFLNLIWIICCGWQLATIHLTSALFLCISIVGIPFAFQSLKLAKLSLFPFGVKII
ncbi:YccF domain-containing protein [Streptococcus hongkongensis]|nr:membrane protein [Streptococcus uberis]